MSVSEQMIIKSAKYFNNMAGEKDHIRATIDDFIWDVPLDPANRHYAEIMRQVDAGELTIADAD